VIIDRKPPDTLILPMVNTISLSKKGLKIPTNNTSGRMILILYRAFKTDNSPIRKAKIRYTAISIKGVISYLSKEVTKNMYITQTSSFPKG
jgi:hypothetical protein